MCPRHLGESNKDKEILMNDVMRYKMRDKTK